MKIMQVNAVYPTGSTGKIVKDIHTYLMECGHDSIVCYGRGDKVKEINVRKIAPELIMKMQSLRSKITGFAYSGCVYSTKTLVKIVKEENPDIVHLHCINSYMVNIYKLLDFLKQQKIKTVLTLHAEFMHTAGCGYALDCEKWRTGCGKCPQKGDGRPSSKIFDRSAEEWKLMQKAFKDFKDIEIACVSEWLFARAKQSPFFTDKNMRVVFNGTDTNSIFVPTKDTNEIKEKLGIRDGKIVLHVTPNFNNPIKGGEYVIKLADSMKDQNVRFLVVGFNGSKSTLPSNVIALERTNNQKELAAYYSIADLTLLTSKKETFSMICAESLACGTPVVGFEAGAPETIALKEYSEFVKQGDVEGLRNLVLKWLDYKETKGDKISKAASEAYSKLKMATSYVEIYERLSQGGIEK